MITNFIAHVQQNIMYITFENYYTYEYMTKNKVTSREILENTEICMYLCCVIEFYVALWCHTSYI